ncbi:MAG: hypothetical protein MH825_13500 [Cyanobacteria bacterium]|nr:hypothetical protein [Cyanobacteriota bacterium]
MKRTSTDAIQTWDDANDLDVLVVDKRSGKRANAAKARRRNRRYGKRLLNVQLRANQTESFDDWEDLA